MGPGDWPVAGPHVAIVSSADVAAEPGRPLGADYWTQREPGESWTRFRVRRQVEDAERRAATHEGHALHLRAEAAAMRLAGGLAPAKPSGEYQRGQAETLAELAGMSAAERADVLDQVAAMIEGLPDGPR
jgi:hypothetical protein